MMDKNKCLYLANNCKPRQLQLPWEMGCRIMRRNLSMMTWHTMYKNICLHLADNPVFPVDIDVHHFQLKCNQIFNYWLRLSFQTNAKKWYLSYVYCINYKKVCIFHLENSSPHVLWRHLEVEGFVENLVIMSSISWRITEKLYRFNPRGSYRLQIHLNILIIDHDIVREIYDQM